MSVYMPLDCDGFAAALADYLEGDAPDAVRAAVEAHAEQCPACGALLEDLRTIRHDAAALPALAPSRDLWSGIAERIDARVIPLGTPARTIVPARRSWSRPAIAAAALIVATAGIAHYATRRAYDPTMTPVVSSRTAAPVVRESPTPTTIDVAEAPATGQPPTDVGDGSETGRPGAQRTELGTPVAVVSTPAPSGTPRTAEQLATAEQPLYDREIAKLRSIVRSRRADLDPTTVAVLEQSIAVIDSAIAQSRAALAKDPASGFLATQLNHSLEKKVELLRTAAMLPART
jgi:Putative zinc-finger